MTEIEILREHNELLKTALKDAEIVLRIVAKDDNSFMLAREAVRDIRGLLRELEKE